MKRILCLAAVVALLLALTSCDREPTLQEIFESQYGNAYIYEDGEHLFLHRTGLTYSFCTDDADYIEHYSGECLIDNTLPYELEPLLLEFRMDAANDPWPGKLEQYGSMWLTYKLTNNSELPIQGVFIDGWTSLEQYLYGEWYRCDTLDSLYATFGGSPGIGEGESSSFRCSLAFAHYNYQREIIPDETNYLGDMTGVTDIYPDRYINFPAGRYRIVQEVGFNKYVSLEFDLTYEDGMCYLHVVEDE